MSDQILVQRFTNREHSPFLPPLSFDLLPLPLVRQTLLHLLLQYRPLRQVHPVDLQHLLATFFPPVSPQFFPSRARCPPINPTHRAKQSTSRATSPSRIQFHLPHYRKSRSFDTLEFVVYRTTIMFDHQHSRLQKGGYEFHTAW